MRMLRRVASFASLWAIWPTPMAQWWAGRSFPKRSFLEFTEGFYFAVGNGLVRVIQVMFEVVS